MRAEAFETSSVRSATAGAAKMRVKLRIRNDWRLL
jgi:hypothetical protein